MKTGFLEKLVAKLDRLDPAVVQSIVDRLLQEKGFFVQVFEALREGVILIGMDERVNFINAAASRFFGLNAESSVGKKLADLVRGMDWQSLMEQSTVVSRDMEVFYPERRYLHFYLAPIEDRETHSGFVMIINDLTSDRAQTQATIESERLGALTLLAAGVAHEIGNPLNSLGIHLQLLDRKIKKLAAGDRQTLEEHLNTARQEIQRLDSILKQFLQAIRPTTLRRERVKIDELCRDVLRLLEPELSARGIRVALDLASDLPVLELDSVQMQQVFHNVLRNAAQAVSQDVEGCITVSIHSNDYEIQILIADNGIGISPEQMGTMFEPYHSTKEGGTGLGLLIVRRIIREHGGEMEIESREGSGTRVSLFLPLAAKKARLLPEPENVIEIPS
ncbi:MAG: two-component system sensor histidine kinase NtrB [Akkermansiaceae bacterium]|jgi:PAS domain S-box-containing protein